MPVQRIIHRRNPFEASRRADAVGRVQAERAPTPTAFFAEREVVNADGTFPFGEGFLYGEEPRARSKRWRPGTGTASAVGAAGHRGSKHEQQDAFGAMRWTRTDERGDAHAVGVVTVADGVSGSGQLARPAARRAVEVFHQVLARELATLPSHDGERHLAVEKAMTRAAIAANFEVIRQVLLNRQRDGRFDVGDKAALREATGMSLPTGRLSVAEMQRLAPALDEALSSGVADHRSALCTLAVAVTVGSDLYTFSSGDAVVGLFRPTEADGERFIHLTSRDQSVTALFREHRTGEVDLDEHADVYENVITDAVGDEAELTGTIRRYPNLLEPGDRVVAASDGLGPRGDGEGLGRVDVEEVLLGHPPGDDGAKAAAEALVAAQLRGLSGDEYQDNIGVCLLDVE